MKDMQIVLPGFDEPRAKRGWAVEHLDSRVRWLPDAGLDRRLQMDGQDLLASIPSGSVPLVVLDPQYPKMVVNCPTLQTGRMNLPQMTHETIQLMIRETARILQPSGHLMLWHDKGALLYGNRDLWMGSTPLTPVDLICWDKQRLGLGRRSRASCEYLSLFQADPVKCDGVFVRRDISDVCREPVSKQHPHRKPLKLTADLIEAVVPREGLVVDPCAGSFTTLEACQMTGRHFYGCDIQ